MCDGAKMAIFWVLYF